MGPKVCVQPLKYLFNGLYTIFKIYFYIYFVRVNSDKKLCITRLYKQKCTECLSAAMGERFRSWMFIVLSNAPVCSEQLNFE